jgi:M6 family metalloprotease-like protein
MKTNLFSRMVLGGLGWLALAASGAAQSAYDRWIDSFGGLSVWEKAPGADPDVDGYPNVAEQLFGLHPTVPLGSDPRRANAPALFLQGRTWQFRYRVDAAAQASGEFTHGIQRTLNLATWLPVTPQISGELYFTPVDFNPARHLYRASISHQARGAIVPLPTFGARSEENLGAFNPDPAGPWELSDASSGDWRGNYGQHWTPLRGGMWKKMAAKFLCEGDNVPVAVLFSAEAFVAEANRRLALRLLVDGAPMRPGDVIFANGGTTETRAARSFEFTGSYDRGLHVVEVQWLADAGASCFMRDAALLVRQGDRADDEGALRPVTPDSGPNLETTSGAWVDVPGLDREITTTSGECLAATVSAEAYASSGRSMWMRVLVDGVEAEPGPVEFAAGRFEGTHTKAWGVAAPSAGLHDVQVQWHADSGGLAGLGDRTLTVAAGRAGTGVPPPHKYFVSAKNAVSAPAAWAAIPNLSQAVVLQPDTDVSVIFTAEFPDAPGGEVRARLSLGGAPVPGSEVMLSDGDTQAGVHAFTFDAKHVAAGGPGLFTTVRVEWMTPDTATTTIRARSMILLVKPHVAPDLAESPAQGLGYVDAGGPAHFRVEPMRGTRHVLVILFDPARPQHPAPSLPDLTEAFFGASDSIADYFSEISGGQLELQSAGVLGPYAADNPWQHYWNGPGDHQDKWVEAITKADDDFDFSAYDFDGDGYLSAWDELAVFVIVPQNTSAGFVRNLWTGEMPVTIDGVYLDLITEWYVNDPLDDYYLGAHELGHQVLILGDLYAKSTTTADVGTRPGVYCLMDGGGYQVASHLNPAYKLALGWVTPRFVTATSQHSLEDVKTSREVIVLPRAPGGPVDEYVIVENRPSPVSNARYDFGLPDAGLAVWHLVESPSDCTLPPGCTSGIIWDTQTGGETARGGIRLVRPGIDFLDVTALWSSEHYDLDGFGLVCPDVGPARNILGWAAGAVSYELRNFPAASGDMTFDIIKP